MMIPEPAPPVQPPVVISEVADSKSQPVSGARVVGPEQVATNGGARVVDEPFPVGPSTVDDELTPPPPRELIAEEEGVSLLESLAIESQTLPEATVEEGLTAFFNSLIFTSAKALFSGILGAALLPFFGPVAAIGVTLTVAAAVTSIQDELKPLDIDLRDDTIQKLIEPLQGKQPNESELRKVIEEVLSKDRQANEDLRQFYIDLLPTIRKAASTNINISGPVQGLIVGNENTITQTFGSFLPQDT